MTESVELIWTLSHAACSALNEAGVRPPEGCAATVLLLAAPEEPEDSNPPAMTQLNYDAESGMWEPGPEVEAAVRADDDI